MSRVVRIQISIPEPKGPAQTTDEIVNERVYQEYMRRRETWGAMRGYILEALQFYERSKLFQGQGQHVAFEQPLEVSQPQIAAPAPTVKSEPKQEVSKTKKAAPHPAVEAAPEPESQPVVVPEPLVETQAQMPMEQEPETPKGEPSVQDLVSKLIGETADKEKPVEQVASVSAPEPVVVPEPEPQPVQEQAAEPEPDPVDDFPEPEDMFPGRKANAKPDFSGFMSG